MRLPIHAPVHRNDMPVVPLVGPHVHLRLQQQPHTLVLVQKRCIFKHHLSSHAAYHAGVVEPPPTEVCILEWVYFVRGLHITPSSTPRCNNNNPHKWPCTIISKSSFLPPSRLQYAYGDGQILCGYTSRASAKASPHALTTRLTSRPMQSPYHHHHHHHCVHQHPLPVALPTLPCCTCYKSSMTQPPPTTTA